MECWLELVIAFNAIRIHLRIHNIRIEERPRYMRACVGTQLPQKTMRAFLRLNCGAMNHLARVRQLIWVSLAACMLLPGCMLHAQEQKPLPLNPGIPGMGSNHRLILKDGSYQMVRKYEIVGDRVRYLSQERGDWEELPASLVDWEATKKWEQNHASGADDSSPAMEEARELDKEEADARADEQARMPEVAKGLNLPDQDGVFALDTFHGTPELVELPPVQVNVKRHLWHGLGTFNPLAGAKANLELDGAHAKVHLHVNDPAIYLSLDSRDDKEDILSHAMTVQTNNAADVANRKHGANSASSGFAIVHLDERREVRIVGAIHVSPTGKVSQSENVIPTKVEVVQGKHWLKLTPATPLLIGEYALVEILSPTDIGQTMWDFRVDPTKGDNEGSLTPVEQ